MREEIYDIIIIGGGPAGLTAGMYAARARMRTLLIESLSVMGQATMTDMIENYPGVDQASGYELISMFRQKAEGFGLAIKQGTVKKVEKPDAGSGNTWIVKDENGEYKTLSVIIASGAKAKKLGIPGETEHSGKGVSYCATCDGPFFRGKEVVVIGGGDTAAEEASFLTKFAAKVTMVHRKNRLRATKILQERLLNNKKINIVYDSVVKEIKGGETIGSVSVENVKTSEIREIKCEGVFVFIGWTPNTEFLPDTVKLDEKGFIRTDKSMKTYQDGIFACGDCINKILYQVVTACGDGATAAFSAQKYVEDVKGIAYK